METTQKVLNKVLIFQNQNQKYTSLSRYVRLYLSRAAPPPAGCICEETQTENPDWGPEGSWTPSLISCRQLLQPRWCQTNLHGRRWGGVLITGHPRTSICSAQAWCHGEVTAVPLTQSQQWPQANPWHILQQHNFKTSVKLSSLRLSWFNNDVITTEVYRPTRTRGLGQQTQNIQWSIGRRVRRMRLLIIVGPLF